MNKSISRYVEEDVGMSLNRVVRKDLVSRFHLNRTLVMKKPALQASASVRRALQQGKSIGRQK